MNKRLPLQRKLLASLIRTAVISAAFVPAITWAQTSDANLRGKAPANAEVTAKNVATGAVRRTKAADDGSYALVGLPPGTYQVDAGPGTERTVTLTVASTGDAGPRSRRRADSDRRHDDDARRHLGQRGDPRRGQDVRSRRHDLAASDPDDSADHAQLPRVRRHRAGHGVHASTRAATRACAAARRTTARSTSTSTASARRTTSRKAASAASSPARAIRSRSWRSASTRSSRRTTRPSTTRSRAPRSRRRRSPARNEFHGEVFGTYTDDNWRAETPAEKHAGKQTPSQDKEYGFAIGGPIIQDADAFLLHLRSQALRHADHGRTPGVTPARRRVACCRPNVAGATRTGRQCRSTRTCTSARSTGSCPTATASKSARRCARKTRPTTSAATIAASAGIDTTNNDTRIDARWQHSADNWFNELLLTYEKAFNDPSSFGLGNGAAYTYRRRQQDATILDDRSGLAAGHAAQGPGGPGDRRQPDLQQSELVRRPRRQDRLQVQGRQADRAGRRAEQPAVLLQRRPRPAPTRRRTRCSSRPPRRA